jgi:hypothetical protein
LLVATNPEILVFQDITILCSVTLLQRKTYSDKLFHLTGHINAACYAMHCTDKFFVRVSLRLYIPVLKYY